MDINNTFLPTTQPCSTTLSFRQACTATHSSPIPTTPHALPVHHPNRLGHEEPYFGRRLHYHARHNRLTSLLYTSLQEILNRIVTLNPHSEEGCPRNDVRIRRANRMGPVDYDLKLYSLYQQRPRPTTASRRELGVNLRICPPSMPRVDEGSGSRGHRGSAASCFRWTESSHLSSGSGDLIEEGTEEGITRWTNEIGKMGRGLLFESMSLLLQSIKDCRKCKFAG